MRYGLRASLAYLERQSAVLTHIFIGILRHLIYHDEIWNDDHNMLFLLPELAYADEGSVRQSLAVAFAGCRGYPHSRHKVLLLRSVGSIG
jgi:hypothetical protein